MSLLILNMLYLVYLARNVFKYKEVFTQQLKCKVQARVICEITKLQYLRVLHFDRFIWIIGFTSILFELHLFSSFCVLKKYIFLLVLLSITLVILCELIIILIVMYALTHDRNVYVELSTGTLCKPLTWFSCSVFISQLFPLFNLLILGVALIKIITASAENVARFNTISVIVYHKSKTYTCIVICVSVLVQPQTIWLLKHCLPLFLWPSWYMICWWSAT